MKMNQWVPQKMSKILWFCYGCVLLFLSLFRLSDYSIVTYQDAVFLGMGQVLEITILMGLFSSVFGWTPGKPWFWKIINALLVVGLVTVVLVAIWLCLYVDIYAGLFSFFTALFLLPITYKLTDIAYKQSKKSETENPEFTCTRYNGCLQK